MMGQMGIQVQIQNILLQQVIQYCSHMMVAITLYLQVDLMYCLQVK